MQPLAPETYRELVRQALAEDRGRGDATSAATITQGARGRGTILAKSELVVAGLDVAIEVFRQCDVGSSRVDLQACKLEYSIVSPK